MKIQGPVPVDKFGNSLRAEQSVEQSWEKRQGLRYLSGRSFASGITVLSFLVAEGGRP